MILISILFLVWFLAYAQSCPCDTPTKTCYRTEFYGFQYGHLFFFTLLGILYPNKFRFWMLIGALWELFEYWLSSRPDIIQKFGGCLSSSKEETPLWLRRVYADRLKYENFIDTYFGIHNSQKHTWHYSIGENFTNALGFMIGMYLKRTIL